MLVEFHLKCRTPGLEVTAIEGLRMPYDLRGHAAKDGRNFLIVSAGTQARLVILGRATIFALKDMPASLAC